jgi:hypothetical protein
VKEGDPHHTAGGKCGRSVVPGRIAPHSHGEQVGGGPWRGPQNT